MGVLRLSGKGVVFKSVRDVCHNISHRRAIALGRSHKLATDGRSHGLRVCWPYI